jgi:hypothetical protein
MISGARPTLSESAPPGVLDALFTTCRATQSSGIIAIGTPS